MFFDSRRSTVMAKNGMIATSQPLAAAAGLRVLMDGGNAVDAAVTSAAVLNVVEPVSTGVGGDMFALVWDNKQKAIRALNASGRSAAASSAENLRAQGHRQMPQFGIETVTVPGAVHGWEVLLKECGTMPLSQVLKPAIRYAEQGYPVTDIIAFQWARQDGRLSKLPSGSEMLLDGQAPKRGQVIRLPTLANTLRAIADGGSDAFYHGEIAEKLASFVQEQGGLITTQDMANDSPDWDDPISTDYRGVTCWECPPNGQGISALEALNIAEGFDIAAMGSQSSPAYHHLIESMRLAFADAFQYIADPRQVSVPAKELRSKEFASGRRELIDPNKALSTVPYGRVHGGSDTVYISCIDGEGNACSFIYSIFANFGTGLVVPGTGIVLHNRGSLFSLDAGHPNELAGGKRPYNTIIPAMATLNGELHLCYGMMGAFMQPQGHLQLISNIVDFGMDPQEAINSLRFMVTDDSVLLEEGVPSNVVTDLQSKGHKIEFISGFHRVGMGGAQMIRRDPETGVLFGGSEPRKDGCALGW